MTDEDGQTDLEMRILADWSGRVGHAERGGGSPRFLFFHHKSIVLGHLDVNLACRGLLNASWTILATVLNRFAGSVGHLGVILCGSWRHLQDPAEA